MSRLFSSVVLACPLCLASIATLADPVYVGARWANPESETFGSVISVPRIPIGYVGDIQVFGSVTGTPEKDTVAFLPVALAHESQPAFGSRGARELQGFGTNVATLGQPADGSRAARELQGLVTMQPADGARAARELQQPDLPVLAQLANGCR